jgi:tRNA/rRNA methyltransferase
VLTVPLNPGFCSLNLAQAVLVVGYEWFTAGSGAPPEILRRGGSRAGTKAELLNFFDHLEEELVKNGFLRNRESRPSMVRNLRSLFQRAQLTEQELRTLHGVVTAFAGPRERPE